MDHARARKHDTDLGNRLTDQAFGLLGRGAVLTITGPQPEDWPMALTITNHLIRCADAPHSAGFGGVIVIWLPGRVLTEGRAAATAAAGAASQIPADCSTTKDSGPRVSAWAGQFGLTGPAGIVQAAG